MQGLDCLTGESAWRGSGRPEPRTSDGMAAKVNQNNEVQAGLLRWGKVCSFLRQCFREVHGPAAGGAPRPAPSTVSPSRKDRFHDLTLPLALVHTFFVVQKARALDGPCLPQGREPSVCTLTAHRRGIRYRLRCTVSRAKAYTSGLGPGATS